MAIPLIPLTIGAAKLAKLAWKPTLNLAKKLVKKYKQADDAVLKRQALSIDELLTTTALVASTPLVVHQLKKDIQEMQDTAREKKEHLDKKPVKGYGSPNVTIHDRQVKKKPKGWGKARYGK